MKLNLRLDEVGEWGHFTRFVCPTLKLARISYAHQDKSHLAPLTRVQDIHMMSSCETKGHNRNWVPDPQKSDSRTTTTHNLSKAKNNDDSPQCLLFVMEI